MKTRSSTFIGLLFFTFSFAQQMYVVNGGNGLKIVDLTTYEVTDLFSVSVSTVGLLTDIAFSPDGTLYGVTTQKKIVEVDFDTESFNVIADLPLDDIYTGLVCSADNILYTSKSLSGTLYLYDLDTGTATTTEGNFSSAGDFTFYKGNLVFPGPDGLFIHSYDGAQIQTVGCSPNLTWTFVNDFTNCDTGIIYGIDQLSNLIRFDLETEDSETLANLFLGAGQVYGGAIPNEYMASQCPTETLNSVSCSLSTNDPNPYGISAGPNPAKDQLYITVQKPYDTFSHAIYTNQGQLVREGAVSSEFIDLSQLSQGLYFLTVRNSQGSSVFQQKIIRQ
ncbi:T9SS type A sorting domain-containing protein [Aureisphaera galaxeae]|uniref:T9SS type A sorting domain-containing protein n=1 Tax=Aureisphaera galaxeae TaxID=1538023 RepID=UPI00235040B2|nr:T9SS type A sorting domain-containing protein [Aureisphaera galaxeae]MDC8005980.1 T9SS type A sorting domain-containing protein [Aureisphaera galaxeae]